MEPTPNGKLQSLRDVLPLPVELTRLYPGKFIIFSEDEQRVIGVGDTEKEAYDQAEASGVDGLWHFSYGDRPDVYRM
jgi:hypothetical protein